MQSRLGTALGDLGELGEATQSIASLRAAPTGYENALQVWTKESLPRDWAATQNNLGAAYVLNQKQFHILGAKV